MKNKRMRDHTEQETCGRAQEMIFSTTDLDYREMEAYKTLYSNVLLAGDDIKVIAFTSYTSTENKSSVVLDASIAYAFMGKRVIVLDANLHQSEWSDFCSEYNIKGGLSRYLLEDISINEVIVKTDIRGVDAIMAGQTVINPYDLLRDVRFRDMIDQLKQKYDYIFIDTPPIGNVVDAKIIANKCDGIIIVVSSKKVNYKELLKVKEQFIKNDNRILGVILNEIKIKKYGKEFKRNCGRYFGEYI